MSGRPTNSRQELEDLWRDRLDEAHRRYEIAKLAGNVSVEDTGDDIPQADGQFALSTALRGESFALKEYLRVLKIFNALVIEGKIPDPEA